MLKNYLKVALRALGKHKSYSFINIAGLALGLACFVLILLFVRDELSYDRFHDHADRIYRVVMDAQPPEAPMDRFALTSRPVGRFLRNEYADEIEHLVRINGWDPSIKHEDQYFYDDDVLFAEPTFFDVFSFPFLEGDAATALNEPFSLVLTASTAQRYFGTERAVGRTLVLNDSLTFSVTGVMGDLPANSHFTTDVLASYATFINQQPENDQEWLNLGGGYTYLLLREGVDPAAFEAKMSDLVMRHFGEVLRNMSFSASLALQPLTSIHLHSDRQAEMGPNGNIAYVYVFSAIALFVLLIACINFMNLATARSMERAREVGVRKVVGSSRGMLIRQFLSESVVMSGLALVAAVGLIAATLPAFNELSGKAISYGTLFQPLHVVALLAIALVVGLLAGSYPAFMLSSFPSVEVLKGAFRTSTRGIWLRKGLVVFQFAVSVALIACTTIVFDQVDFMQSQDLGFNEEQVLVVDAQGLPSDVMTQQYETAKSEFGRLPGVQQVSASTVVPGRGAWLLLFNAEGRPEDDIRRAQVVSADEDYIETFGIELVAGRMLSEDFPSDRQESALVNERAVEDIGWGSPEEAIGKTISLGNGPDRTVVGVIGDYHHQSLQQVIEPMLVLSVPPSYNFFSMRVAADDLPGLMTQLDAAWNRLFPGYTFETFFVDADFDNQYQAEQRLTRIFGTFATLAILIACLGLFGLAAFTAEQRTKEIGVRKVLGASVAGIILLLSKEFTRLVLVAMVVAAPVAYWVMDRWLDGFAYRVEISWWIFLVSGLAALGVAWVTVSYQSVRAALANPVKSLRYE